MDSPPTTLTERLFNRVMKFSNSKLPDSIESSLNNILKELFVLPSLKMGLLGDPKKFNITGDGTCMPTHASHYGKKAGIFTLKELVDHYPELKSRYSIFDSGYDNASFYRLNQF